MHQLRKLVLLLTLPACFDFTAEPFGEKGLHCDIGSKCDPGLVCDANDYCVDRCDEVRCGDHGGCKHNPDGSAFCSCDSGYVSTAEPKCVPVGSKDAPCGPSAICDLGLTCSGDICVDACAQLNCGEHGACALQDNVARCNCDSGYKEVQGTCMDNCTDVSCSGHGACVLSGGEPTCDCESGYEASGLNCVVPSCVPTSHAAQHCDSGSLYWYDSCGAREGVAASCGTRGCTGDACKTPEVYGLGGSLSGILTANTPNHDLAMNNVGEPTLAWRVSATAVARWTGTTWQQYAGPPAGTDAYGIALDASGAPYLPQYVTAGDPTTYEQLHIMRWSAVWSEVGATPLGLDSDGRDTIYASLAVASNGTPYVAWISGRFVYVKAYNGSAWVELGGSATDTGISDAVAVEVLSISIKLTATGLPVVSWITRTPSDGSIFYLKHWTGSAWEGYGGSGAGLGLGTASKGTVALDGERPIVAYRSGIDVLVKSWSGSRWVNLVSGAEDAAALATNTYVDRPTVVVPRVNTVLVTYGQRQTTGTTIAAQYLEDGVWHPLGENGGVLSTNEPYFFGLTAAASGGRGCIAWRQGNPTSAYIACAKF